MKFRLNFAKFLKDISSHKELVKVKLSLCLTKHHAMKAYGKVEV